MPISTRALHLTIKKPAKAIKTHENNSDQDRSVADQDRRFAG